MSDQTTHELLRAVQDRASIIDVVCKFAVSIDRRRWDDLASCFADELDVNSIRTGRWVHFERAALIDLLRPAFESYTATQHVSANHQVSIDGDSAVVWSTLNATHYVRGAEGGEYQQQVGYYEYRLVRRQDWKIVSIHQHPSWQRGNQQLFDSTVVNASVVDDGKAQDTVA
jgi:hypothetical protein